MRLLNLLALAALSVSPVLGGPLNNREQNKEEVIEVITTLSGRTYHHCRIYKVDPDGVTFFHDRGGAKVLFLDLPQDIAQQLGYDPQKAASYEDDLAKKREKRREQAEARRRAINAQAALAQLSDAGAAGRAPYEIPFNPFAAGDLVYPTGFPYEAGFGVQTTNGTGATSTQNCLTDATGINHLRKHLSQRALVGDVYPTASTGYGVINRRVPARQYVAPTYGIPALGAPAPAIAAPVRTGPVAPPLAVRR